MMNEYQNSAGVVIIGGGLAGLTTAAFLARTGHTVILFEQAQRLGGRAQTQSNQGFFFNLGPHALYRGGAGVRILEELGIEFSGTVPNPISYAIRDGHKYKLPVNPLALFTTGLLGLPAKIELARFLARLPTLDPEPFQNVPISHWLERSVKRPEVRQLLEALFRLFTYANDPEQQSAGAVITQGQLAAAKNVYYLDYGWQTLVDGLRRAAESAGARIVTGAKVAAIEWDRPAGVRGVRLVDGTTYTASAVVVAATPAVTCDVVERSEETILHKWFNAARPIMAACLDIGLRSLPEPRSQFALGIDRPLYFSNHSAFAKMTATDGALIHAVKYLHPDDDVDSKANERELEELVSLMQPGWRDALVERRYLPQMVVANTVIMAAQGGAGGRPGPAVPGIPNLYVAGDWVGPEGMLSDASFASAKQAATMIVAAEKMARISPQPVAIGSVIEERRAGPAAVFR